MCAVVHADVTPPLQVDTLRDQLRAARQEAVDAEAAAASARQQTTTEVAVLKSSLASTKAHAKALQTSLSESQVASIPWSSTPYGGPSRVVCVTRRI